MKFEVLEKTGVSVDGKFFPKGAKGDEDASAVTALARTFSVKIIEPEPKKEKP